MGAIQSPSTPLVELASDHWSPPLTTVIGLRMAVLSTSDDIGQVLVVTVVYFVVYYAFMVQQLQGKAYRGSQDSAAIELDRMCDRTFLNCLEQMVPFTLTLWLHALFVDAWVSAVLGWVAVVARLLFPVFWSLDGH